MRLINNVYVKNIPKEFNESDLRRLFEPYGNIKSVALKTHQLGNFGFVCYEDPNGGKDKLYGPEAAQKAIEALNGTKLSQDTELYVRHALTSSQRLVEKTRSAMSYKASKKRCNLYVKGFPKDWSKDQIVNLFNQYGVIENIRLENNVQGKDAQPFAFVCFNDPQEAANAKQALAGQMLQGCTKPLTINFYEIKEERIIQNEEARDKADWERYMAQQQSLTGKSPLSFKAQPRLTAMVNQLLNLIRSTELDQAQANQVERSKTKPKGTNEKAGMPTPQAPQQTPTGDVAAPAQRYYMAAQRILPAVTDKNPHLKDMVGEVIYDYVTMSVGNELAPKITGMLISLSAHEITQYLGSLEALKAKTFEARDHLMAA